MEEVTFSEVISYAKIAEENAKKFYLDAASNAKMSNMKEYLKSLADEEQVHIDRLEALQKSFQEKGVVPSVHNEIQNLGYADYIKPMKLDVNATLKDVLEVAMANEKEAIKSYQVFTKYVENDEARKLFEILLQEEKRHLKRFEEEYDDLQDQYY